MPNKKSVKKLTNALKECTIASSVPSTSLVLSETYDLDLVLRWPKQTAKIPDVFLHKPIDLAKHVRKILSLGIQFYKPSVNRYYTKITCVSFNDHKALVQYFESKQLPFHTFGHPSKNKMKVVIRGLPNDTDLNKIKSEIKSGRIPIIRVHKMHRRPNIKDDKALILAVVPFNEEGKRILLVKKILGYNVKMEPPKVKAKQCYRCQMWGHSQRYCRGETKCVKCAGNHFSKKCGIDMTDKTLLKCANCGGKHTASYRRCARCPESIAHQCSVLDKLDNHTRRSNVLVTLDNCDQLYKNRIYLREIQVLL